MLQHLIHSLSSRPLMKYQRHAVFAFDIDEHLVAECKENYKSSPSISISIQCDNFLDLSRRKLREEINRVRGTQDKFQLIFIGNPPYSNGLGNGATIIRDLPLQFITHSIVTLGSEFVSFIVPKRCNNKIKDTQDFLEEATLTQWMCDSYNLEDSLFSFKGEVVKQPSVLQCWRTDEA